MTAADRSRSSWRRVSDDVLESRSGIGCQIAIGLPLALAGGTVLLIVSRALPAAGRQGADASGVVVMAAFGAGALLLGALLLFGRSGQRIDRAARVHVAWSSLGLPLRCKETSLARYDRVTIELDSSGDGPSDYPVRIAGPDGVEPIRLAAPSSHASARLTAEEVARLLRLPVEDSSSGQTVRREADHLDETLRERLRAGERPPSPALPAAPLRTRVTPGADGLTIELDRLRPPFAACLETVALVGFLVMTISTLGRLLWSPGARPFVLVVAGLFAVLALARIAAGTRLATRVVAGPASLRVEERFLLRRVVIEIPIDELEELELRRRPTRAHPPRGPRSREMEQVVTIGRLPDGRPLPAWVDRLARLVPTPGITARSDRVAVTFFERVPEEELRYLHALLLRAIA